MTTLYPDVYSNFYPGLTFGGSQVADSLIIAEQFELIGPGGSPLDPHGTPSLDPVLQGAVFRVSNPADAYASGLGGVFSESGYSLGAPQPTTDIVGSLLLDGERPFGYRASDRTIVLPVIIKAPNFQALIAARESLLREVDQQTWTLRWTRDTTGTFAGNPNPLPLLFDCFRAQPTVVSWGAFYNRIPYGILVLTFQALPYGRSDLPVTVDFPSPLTWKTPAPPSQVIDAYSSVSGAQWAASTQSPVAGGESAFWDPSISPANNPTGIGASCNYSKSGLAVNMSGGWLATAEAAGTTNQMAILQAPAGVPNQINVGDQFQLAGNFLTGQNSGFEGGLGNWAPSANCSVADSSAQAHTGSDSMAMTASAAGNMSAYYNVPPTGGLAVPCLGGDSMIVWGYFRAATVSRQCQIGFFFYDINGNFIQSSLGAVPGGASSIADSTSAWTQATLNYATAPQNAVWALPVAQVLSAAGSGEVHYVDDVWVAARGSALLQTQIFTVAAITGPSGGMQNIQFTPSAASAPGIGDVAIQTGPPRLSGLTFWAGFGSSKYYTAWARLGGRVTFAVTLTDTYGTSLNLCQTAQVSGSNNSGAPKWTKIRVPVTWQPGFDYANVAAYSITITNRGTSDLRYTQCYLSQMTAQAAPVTAAMNMRAAVYELAGLAGSARAPCSLQFQQQGSQNVTQLLNTPGTHQWLCPAGVTSVGVFAIGPGGGGGRFPTGNGGGGGGGGGSAQNAAVAVTPGNLYTYTVGAGGNALINLTGANTVFTGDSASVTAFAGNNGFGASGGPGGIAGVGGFAGGTGGAGVSGGSGGGGGGGSSAGTSAAGGAGGAASGSNGGAGGTAPAGGYPGGRGGTLNKGNGVQGNEGWGGGGSGGSPGNATGFYYIGSSGAIVLTYTQTPTFQTLLVHRPPVTAPADLVPYVSPSIGDTPNGLTYYPLQGLEPNFYPRFGGTYTVVVVAYAWDSPANPRTITVGVTQNEQTGGATYYSQVSAVITPNTLPQCSDTNALYGPMVVIGEMTLPLQDIPPDNLHCNFVVDIASSDTSDSFMDILFLDTMGSTVIIQSPTAYTNYYLDEAPSDRDLGLIGGSLYDRADAISVLDRATVAGGPMSVDPFGNPMLLVYAAEGAPSCEMTYFPRWFLDRWQ